MIKTILLLCILSLPCLAQHRLDAGDAVYWTGSSLDLATSAGKREAGVFRTADGRFALGPNLALKSGLWAGIKLLEWKQPQHRKAFMWTKICIGAAYTSVALFHNRRVR